MISQQTLQVALLCLCALDEHIEKPLTAKEVSQAQGMPLPECQDALERLSTAGLVNAVEDGRYSLPRPACELRALEVWQAVAAVREKQPAFQLWVGDRKDQALQATLEAVHMTSRQQG